ncbi:hypothetical protein JTE90_010381 [Oedothorax gibbosus]|uniref:Uncharacterized protein n=1 Tax=Oedothorax gibbosus TaxID=931172 RepID=A0AAV6W3A3_9ARAC|nr:hypothetical protein JTE90_010381 [Oedothorax gibbosus]
MMKGYYRNFVQVTIIRVKILASGQRVLSKCPNSPLPPIVHLGVAVDWWRGSHVTAARVQGFESCRILISKLRRDRIGAVP